MTLRYLAYNFTHCGTNQASAWKMKLMSNDCQQKKIELTEDFKQILLITLILKQNNTIKMSAMAKTRNECSKKRILILSFTNYFCVSEFLMLFSINLTRFLNFDRGIDMHL